MEKRNASETGVGRKREYSSPAERQKAYRLRKKQANSEARQVELRVSISLGAKKRLGRLSAHQKCSVVDMLERLLADREDIVLKEIERAGKGIEEYML